MRSYPGPRAVLPLLGIIAIVGLLRPLEAQTLLKVSTDFEGGSARNIQVEAESRTIQIKPGGDPNRGWASWWAIRIDNAQPGQALTVELSASDQPTRNNGELTTKPLYAGWAMPARAAISHDGSRWQHSAPGVRAGSRIRYQISP